MPLLRFEFSDVEKDESRGVYEIFRFQILIVTFKCSLSSILYCGC